MTWPRRSSKSRASKTACSRATSKARPRRSGVRGVVGSESTFHAPAELPRGDYEKSTLTLTAGLEAQEENRRPLSKLDAGRRAPRGNRTAGDLLARKRQVARDAKAQRRPACREYRRD